MKVSIGIPKDGTYWGLASVDNMNLQPVHLTVKNVIQAEAKRLDSEVPESEGDVLLLKVLRETQFSGRMLFQGPIARTALLFHDDSNF